MALETLDRSTEKRADKNPACEIHSQLHIGGKWQSSVSGQTHQVKSPATGEDLGTVAKGNDEDIDLAVSAARKACPELVKMGVWERGNRCIRVAELIESRQESIGRILALEHGKPYKEALEELYYTAVMWRGAGEQVKYLETPAIPVADTSKRVFCVRQPRGVYGCITPTNYPTAVASEHLTAALATGNAVVWIPPITCGMACAEFLKCILEAGFPEGAINMVTGLGPVVGEAVVKHPDVNGISFTGSTRVGTRISEIAVLKPLLLELGGCDPAIVFEDADLEAAAKQMCVNTFYNAGQTCTSTGRVMVHRRVADELTELLVKTAREIQLGLPFDNDTTMGPLHVEHTVNQLDDFMQDAVTQGAEVLTGGRRAKGFPTSCFFEPTVLRGLKTSMKFNLHESFGPVLPVCTFEGENEAIELANSSTLGLAVAIFTRRSDVAFRMGEAIKTGLVVINDWSSYWEPHMPFGGGSGSKSGLGRIGGRFAMEEMTQLKTFAWHVPPAGSVQEITNPVGQLKDSLH